MPRRKLKEKSLKIEVTVTCVEDELVARASWVLGMSKGDYIKSGKLFDVLSGETGFNVEETLAQLRRQQKGVKNIWRGQK